MAKNPGQNTRPTNSQRIEILQASTDATRRMVSEHRSSIAALKEMATRLEASGLVSMAGDLKLLIEQKQQVMSPDAVAQLVSKYLDEYVEQRGWTRRITQLETDVKGLKTSVSQASANADTALARATAVQDNLEATNERVTILEDETVQKSPWLPLASFVLVTAVVFLLQRWGHDNDTPWMAQLGLAIVIGGLSAWVLDKLPVKVRSRISIRRTTPAPAATPAAQADPAPQPANQMAVRQDKVSAN